MSLHTLKKVALSYIQEVGKLPEDFKSRWVFALRSEEFKQGMAALCSRSQSSLTYCCLGVAGVVAGINNKDLMDRMYIRSDWGGAIPMQLLEGTPLVAFLTHVNDEYVNWTFPKIADWIEANC